MTEHSGDDLEATHRALLAMPADPLFSRLPTAVFAFEAIWFKPWAMQVTASSSDDVPVAAAFARGVLRRVPDIAQPGVHCGPIAQLRALVLQQTVHHIFRWA